jgi:hypothetical protein
MWVLPHVGTNHGHADGDGPHCSGIAGWSDGAGEPLACMFDVQRSQGKPHCGYRPGFGRNRAHLQSSASSMGGPFRVEFVGRYDSWQDGDWQSYCRCRPLESRRNRGSSTLLGHCRVASSQGLKRIRLGRQPTRPSGRTHRLGRQPTRPLGGACRLEQCARRRSPNRLPTSE